jgi:hypothetical protein
MNEPTNKPDGAGVGYLEPTTTPQHYKRNIVLGAGGTFVSLVGMVVEGAKFIGNQVSRVDPYGIPIVDRIPEILQESHKFYVKLIPNDPAVNYDPNIILPIALVSLAYCGKWTIRSWREWRQSRQAGDIETLTEDSSADQPPLEETGKTNQETAAPQLDFYAALRELGGGIEGRVRAGVERRRKEHDQQIGI